MTGTKGPGSETFDAMSYGGYGREARGAPRRILVVEDSQSSRRLLQALLMRLGVELPNLRLVASEQEALRVFTQWQPDIVFLDLELRVDPREPVPQGAAAKEPVGGAGLAVQFLKRNPSVKIIVCSAKDPADSPLAAMVRNGEVLGLVKPVLAAKVQDALARCGPRTPGFGPVGRGGSGPVPQR